MDNNLERKKLINDLRDKIKNKAKEIENLTEKAIQKISEISNSTEIAIEIKKKEDKNKKKEGKKQ